MYEIRHAKGHVQLVSRCVTAFSSSYIQEIRLYSARVVDPYVNTYFRDLCIFGKYRPCLCNLRQGKCRRKRWHDPNRCLHRKGQKYEFVFQLSYTMIQVWWTFGTSHGFTIVDERYFLYNIKVIQPIGGISLAENYLTAIIANLKTTPNINDLKYYLRTNRRYSCLTIYSTVFCSSCCITFHLMLHWFRYISLDVVSLFCCTIFNTSVQNNNFHNLRHWTVLASRLNNRHQYNLSHL